MCLESNLRKILKAENGGDDNKDKAELNTQGLAGVMKMLQDKTGRESFTMEELMNPKLTLEKYKKG